MAIKISIEALDARKTITHEKLEQSLITFGRSKSCHIELDHHEVSKRHFIIKYVDNNYILLDEGSRFGTTVDSNKLKPQRSFSLGKEHLIVVPGFFIKLFCDGQKPKTDRTTVVAKTLLDELLKTNVELRKCPHLRSADGVYHFEFVEEKTSFVLGTLSQVDFVLSGENIGKKHASFTRDIFGIRLIPLFGHVVSLNKAVISKPHILTNNDIIEIGNLELIFYESGENNEQTNERSDKNELKETTTDKKNLAVKEQQTLPKEKKVFKKSLKITDHVFLFIFLIAFFGASLMLFKMI